MKIVSVFLVALLVSGALTASCTVNRSSPLYKQCDSKWGSDGLGSSSTICKVGCLISAVSMALAGAGKKIGGAVPTPKNLNSFLKANGGYSGNGFVWGSVERFGVKYEGKVSDKNAVRTAICGNKIVILNVNNGGHWVLATGFNGDTFNVNDAGYSRTTYGVKDFGLVAIYRLA